LPARVRFGRRSMTSWVERTDGLIVDLSDVAFIDSSGLAVIVGVDEQLRRNRLSLAVVAPCGTAAAVLLTRGASSSPERFR
jgi:anti-anti-sigma factor